MAVFGRSAREPPNRESHTTGNSENHYGDQQSHNPSAFFLPSLPF
jgi:hypothetical protein